MAVNSEKVFVTKKKKRLFLLLFSGRKKTMHGSTIWEKIRTLMQRLSGEEEETSWKFFLTSNEIAKIWAL